MKRILVESSIRSFGDILTAYSILPIMKYKYPNSNLSFGCGKYETPLFRRSKIIDNVVLQSAYGNISTWTQYEYKLTKPFGLDEQWQSEKYIGGYDNCKVWKECIDLGYGLDIVFLDDDRKFFEENFKKHLPKDKKIVGFYYNTPTPSMGDLWPLFALNVNRICQIINNAPDNLFFVLFTNLPTAIPVQFPKMKNAVVFGGIDLVTMGVMFEQIDCLLGVASPILSSYSFLFDTPRVIISSIGDDDVNMWDGVPDICMFPHLRFLNLSLPLHKNSFANYVYPVESSNIIKWPVKNALNGKEEVKQMRPLDNIDSEEIYDNIDTAFDGVKNSYAVCNRCSRNKTGECIYKEIERPVVGDWEWFHV